MFDSPALNIVIGLVFIYLLYSLLATIVQEIVATWVGLRAKNLQKAIIRMLNDNDKTVIGEISALTRLTDRLKRLFFLTEDHFKGTLAQKFYNLPGIKYLGEDSWHSKPSYLNAATFAQNVIHLLRGEDFKSGDDTLAAISRTLAARQVNGIRSGDQITLGGETIVYLQSLLIDANNDIEKFKVSLQGWFDETMERATGWYKRQAQMILFMIGFGIAVAFNVDTFYIVGFLSKDKEATNQLVKLASDGEEKYGSMVQLVSKNKTDSPAVETNADDRAKVMDSAYRVVRGDIDEVSKLIGLGWKVPDKKDPALCKDLFKDDSTKAVACVSCIQKQLECSSDDEMGFCSKLVFVSRTGQWTAKSIIGWLITALAISLGAPFWYDLLKKLVNMRGSGTNPDEAKKADQKKNDPKLNAAG